MLCQRCRTSLLSRLPFRQQGSTSLQASRCTTLVPYRQSLRHYSAPASGNPSSPQSSSTPSVALPSVALPSVAPPSLSAPVTLTRNEPSRVMSGTPAGTKLKGINYMKNKPEVFALEDHEYPDWLWGLLDEAKARSKADGSAHLSSKSMILRLSHPYRFHLCILLV